MHASRFGGTKRDKAVGPHFTIVRRMVQPPAHHHKSGFRYHHDDSGDEADNSRRKGQWETVIVPRHAVAAAEPCHSSRLSYEVTVYFPEEAMPFLIGIGGRNLALISRHAAVTLHMHQDSVTIAQRHAADHHRSSSKRKQRQAAVLSDIDLAHRLVVSSCTGGFVRWFNRVVDTEALVPPDVLKELDELVQEHHQSSLKLLQASTGHMCLVIVPNSIGGAEANVADARKAVLQHLLERSSPPTTAATTERVQSSSSSSSSSSTAAADPH